MRPTFFRKPRRLMLHVRMHMWGKMMPNRGQSNFPARISPDGLQFLSSGDDHSFVRVPCMYASLDW